MSSVVSSLSDDDASSGPSRREHRVDNANASHLMPPSAGGINPHHQAASQGLLSGNDDGLRKKAGFEERELGVGVEQHLNSGNPSLFDDWWAWEIVAVMLSLAATAAIIIILAVYDGHPLPSWPYKITLNSLLSVLSTIAKVGCFQNLKLF